MDKPTILIVDDEPINLSLLTELLRSDYRVRAANSGQHALRAAITCPRPDLILLDVMMPELDGYAVLDTLRGQPETQDIPVIFLTALNDPTDEERGLEYGARDYITKPIKPAVLRARVRTQLEVKQARDFLENKNAILEAEIARRMVDNEITQQVCIRALAHLAETRDPETGNHILRTQVYVRLLAEKLAAHPRFQAMLIPSTIDLLTKSAPLHDIGKVGIPDSILLKPGPLNDDEWRIMKTHARQGFDAIERAEADVDHPVPFLILAKEIARWHHEKWDGSGYPDGLAGDDIPISARIMTVADVFDAMTSARIYKPALPMSKAREFIGDARGQHFDPDVTDAFMAVYDEFTQIAQRHPDAESV
ncbi:putative two-component system response regulator [Ectothiorhodospira magna]|uniref:Putative two-component system response regulator n=1 Tax=Ectothiorhodospira magna TaxID=867345 RepID=A0A1H9ASU1_9GAMM|nr:two-component system response regulator [Ectothiorhodospira magna]SEP79601.1 putative two-component system response regulator [Ectothiorhodospira magna]